MPTIGVAVAIPDPWGSRLQEYRASLGDTDAHLIPTHITLLPPTEISTGDLPELHAHLEEAAAAVPAYRVMLRGTGTFRPVSPVVFVAVAEGIGGCEQLASRVRSGPLAVVLDFPYHPHVTVAHNIEDAGLDRAFEELAGFECTFEVDEFHLYLHDDDTGWHPDRTYRLG